MINLTDVQKISMSLICHLYVNFSINIMSVCYECMLNAECLCKAYTQRNSVFI